MRISGQQCLQWMVRTLLGVILLPVVCCAFMVFSLVAASSDRLISPAWQRIHKWFSPEARPAPAGAFEE